MSKEFTPQIPNLKHINTIKDQFVKRGYEKTLIEKQIEKVAKLDRSVLFAEQNKSKKTSCLRLSVTDNRTLLNFKNTSAILALVKNRLNIRGDISANP